MPRQHAPLCDLNPDRHGHGLYFVSRPIARQAVASNEQGNAVDITVDLAVPWANLGSPRLVRVISEPPNIDGRFVAIMASGTVGSSPPRYSSQLDRLRS